MAPKTSLHLDTWADVIALHPSAKNAGHHLAEDLWDKSYSAPSAGGLGEAKTLAGAERLIRDGWPAGLKRIQEALGRLELPRAQSIRRRPVRTDMGDHVDIQAVYRGDLDRAWTTCKRQPGQGRPTVSVYVHIGARANLRPEEFFWRGATAVALCDSLEASGRRVEIVGFNDVANVFAGKPNARHTYTIKRFHELLDLEKITTMLCLPSTHRVFSFRAHLAINFRAGAGMGSSHYTSPQVFKREDFLEEHSGIAKEPESPDVIRIDGIWDEEDAKGFLGQAVEKITAPVATRR